MREPEPAHECHLCAIRDGAPDTPFASLFPDRASESQVLRRLESVFVTIDVAPIGPGHCLIVPHAHRLSYAQASMQEIAETESCIAALNGVIAHAHGTQVVFFEHGQCTESEDSTGCGISHAHLHAVARHPERGLTEIDGIEFDPVDGLAGLRPYRSDRGYLYVQGPDGAFAARPTRSISQVLRRHFAWPGYLSDAAQRDWSWSDHVTYSDLVGTADRVAANLDVMTEGLRRDAAGQSLTP